MEKELTRLPETAPAAVEMQTFMTQTLALMQGMAEMVRATNERMAAMEMQVRMLEKVTPSQATELNRAIRERTAEVVDEYRLNGMDKPVAAAIRKAVRLSTGAHSVREIARCDYKPILDMVAIWDDYKAIKAIKAKGARV